MIPTASSPASAGYTDTEPLIQQYRGGRHASSGPPPPSGDDGDGDGDADDGKPLSSSTADKPLHMPSSNPSIFVWLLTLAAGVSGLLFGYDTGIISSTLVSVSSSLSGRELTTLDKSLITSSTSLLALIASPLTGMLADTVGRRRVILVASLLFAVGAAVQSASRTVATMIAGRAVVGLAVGSASFVVPLYVAELSPAEYRGRLVVLTSLFITGGQVVAYLVGWGFSRVDGGWRWMVGLGAVPAAAQLAMLVAMPETPRWLVKVGREDEAAAVLRKVHGAGDEVETDIKALLRQIAEEIRREEEVTASLHDIDIDVLRDSAPLKVKATGLPTSLRKLFTVGSNRRALMIACLLQASQQLSGFNSLMYFSATIFSLVGFSSPTLTSLVVATTNFIFTLVAYFAIDRIGRRRILLWSVPFMVIAMATASFSFTFLSFESKSLNDASDRLSDRGPWPQVLLLATALYVAAYALGLGNVPWQQSELFALSVRSVGSGLSTATNWGANFVVGLTFLPMMDLITPSGAFAVFAVVCIVSWVLIWYIYPETAGLGLEEVGSLLSNGFGVEESLSNWKRRREGYRAANGS